MLVDLLPLVVEAIILRMSALHLSCKFCGNNMLNWLHWTILSRCFRLLGVWNKLLNFCFLEDLKKQNLRLLFVSIFIFQAFTIAFTSQTIPKLVYYYHHSLENYPEYTTQVCLASAVFFTDCSCLKLIRLRPWPIVSLLEQERHRSLE